jgi:predicted PurR-regulated permease PerM
MRAGEAVSDAELAAELRRVLRRVLLAGDVVAPCTVASRCGPDGKWVTWCGRVGDASNRLTPDETEAAVFGGVPLRSTAEQPIAFPTRARAQEKELREIMGRKLEDCLGERGSWRAPADPMLTPPTSAELQVPFRASWTTPTKLPPKLQQLPAANTASHPEPESQEEAGAARMRTTSEDVRLLRSRSTIEMEDEERETAEVGGPAAAEAAMMAAAASGGLDHHASMSVFRDIFQELFIRGQGTAPSPLATVVAMPDEQRHQRKCHGCRDCVATCGIRTVLSARYLRLPRAIAAVLTLVLTSLVLFGIGTMVKSEITELWEGEEAGAFRENLLTFAESSQRFSLDLGFRIPEIDSMLGDSVCNCVKEDPAACFKLDNGGRSTTIRQCCNPELMPSNNLHTRMLLNLTQQRYCCLRDEIDKWNSKEADNSTFATPAKYCVSRLGQRNSTRIEGFELRERGVLLMADFLTTGGAVASIASDFVLTLLFSLYLLFTRSEGRVFGAAASKSMFFYDVEVEISEYVSQKTAISMLTAILVAVTLAVCGVPLAALFGVLTFLFNYIPNVGSVIATFLPIPIMILMAMPDEEPVAFLVAIIVPLVVQTTVGNFLEPIVLGNALNLGAVQVLAALVFWGVVWDLPGAIISTPLLSITKIILEHTDHKLARNALRYIAQDPDKKHREEERARDLVCQMALQKLDEKNQAIAQRLEQTPGALSRPSTRGRLQQSEKRLLEVFEATQASISHTRLAKGEAPTTNLIFVVVACPTPAGPDWRGVAKTLRVAIGLSEAPEVFDLAEYPEISQADGWNSPGRVCHQVQISTERARRHIRL